MELLLEQLKKKTTPNQQKGIIVHMKPPTKNDELEAKSDNVTNEEELNDNGQTGDVEKENKVDNRSNHFHIIDKRKVSNIDRDAILERIYNNTIHYDNNVITEPIVTTTEDNIDKEQSKKTITQKKLVIKDTIADNTNKQIEFLDQPETLDEEIINTPVEKVIKTRKRKPKTVSTININEAVIEGEKLKERLPVAEKQSYRVSPYYMNNRKMFIQKINHLFQPYAEQLKTMDDVSCDNRDSEEDFSLLIHQKIVRDYINLYTPYRGLLLMHGLGSGKTCTSIAIAEGMKTDKKVILMTPASLKANFFAELKKCGDTLFKKNQFWQFISTTGNVDYVNILSSALSLPKEFIEKHNGAWLVDKRKPSNFSDLTAYEQKQLDEQLDEMIRTKYVDINYNGLNKGIIDFHTQNNTVNFFDNAVVVIDEAHNFVSRIVNKVKEKSSLSYTLYELLMKASNARIVLLTGTPIINYPHEISILFNILRGYITTWTFPVTVRTKSKINKDAIMKFFEDADFKTYDYIEYSDNKLVVTRNPYGFVNDKKRASKKTENNSIFENYNGVKLNDAGNISDEDFKTAIIRILQKNDLDVHKDAIHIDYFKALPDNPDVFNKTFINIDDVSLKNENLLQRRILGLTSYFKSAQENLLPRFVETEEGGHIHIVATEMSDYQFDQYEGIRKDEADKEKRMRRASKKKKQDELYKPASSYRIFSRLCCNYAFPKPPGRPFPDKITDMTEENVDGIDQSNKQVSYQEKIQEALQVLRENPDKYLSPDGLMTYSPKFLEVLTNIKNRDHIGLHLLYSQFRTIEGIEIMKMVLEANGFVQFKLKKTDTIYELDIDEEDLEKPKFILYTGTEEQEEKEIMRNIYNSSWELVPVNILNEVRKMHENNFLGEVIKVMMITSSGAEGINLKNTRFVHILEPYWHMVRINQVIGRARRICSHQDLPDEMRTVQVFLYMSTLSDAVSEGDKHKELITRDISKIDNKTPVTTDEDLYDISRIKDKINHQILKSIKETSIDCSIHENKEDIVCFNYGRVISNSMGSVPSIEKDEFEKTDQNKEIKEKLVSITVDGVTYAYNRTANIVYDFNSYMKSKKTGEPLKRIGRIVKKGRKNTLELDI